MLCTACQHLPEHLNVRSFLESDLRFNQCQHHSSFTALEAAARDGCHLCNVIQRSIDYDLLAGWIFTKHPPEQWRVFLRRNGIVPREAPPHSIVVLLQHFKSHALPPNENDEDRFQEYVEDTKQVTYLTYDFPGAAPDEQVFDIDPYSFDEDGSYKKLPWSRKPISKDVLSEENIEDFKFWVNDCVDNHDECQRTPPSLSDPTSNFPTRLVDVGERSNSWPRLVTFEETKRPYLTLSHCWGPNSKSMLTTTTSTYEIRRKSIPMFLLPPTFHDAITLTRRLGYRYIWIDALCIIQDSPSDWEYESSKMGGVYANSLCCIAATAADSCETGFCSPRNPLQVDPCIMDWPGEVELGSKVKKTFPVRIWPRTRRDIDSEIRGPLDSRAWTLQERVLSPRIIHFTEREIYWSCSRWISSESGESLRTPEGWSEGVRIDAVGSSGEPNERAPYALWYDWIRQTSARNLTYDSDKLAVMGGMAREIEKRTGDEYWAGLWKKDILFGLACWRTDLDEFGRKPSSGYRAPSWSWAALDGKLTVLDQDEVPTSSAGNAEVTKFDVKTAGMDRMGRIQYAKLEIVGHLKNVLLVDSHEWGEATWREKGTGESRCTGECSFDCGQVPAGTEFYFLRVVTTNNTRVNEECIRGLCLASVEGTEDCYTRIGVGEINSEWLNSDSPDGRKKIVIL